MSCDVKAIGTLTFDSVDELEEAHESLDDEDESVAEVRELVKHGTSRKRATLRIADSALSRSSRTLAFGRNEASTKRAHL